MFADLLLGRPIALPKGKKKTYRVEPEKTKAIQVKPEKKSKELPPKKLVEDGRPTNTAEHGEICRNKILFLAENNETIFAEMVAEDCNILKSSANRHLRTMASKGLIDRVSKANNFEIALFRKKNEDQTTQ